MRLGNYFWISVWRGFPFILLGFPLFSLLFRVFHWFPLFLIWFSFIFFTFCIFLCFCHWFSYVFFVFLACSSLFLVFLWLSFIFFFAFLCFFHWCSLFFCWFSCILLTFLCFSLAFLAFPLVFTSKPSFPDLQNRPIQVIHTSSSFTRLGSTLQSVALEFQWVPCRPFALVQVTATGSSESRRCTITSTALSLITMGHHEVLISSLLHRNIQEPYGTVTTMATCFNMLQPNSQKNTDLGPQPTAPCGWSVAQRSPSMRRRWRWYQTCAW